MFSNVNIVVFRGVIQVAAFIVHYCRRAMNVPDRFDRTPLHIAAMHGQVLSFLII